MNYFKTAVTRIITSLVIAMLIFSCSKEKENESKPMVQENEQKKTEMKAPETKAEIKEITFSEFAVVFVEKAKQSEESFLKYCSDKVNGKDPSNAYKTFLDYSKLKPAIKEGSITFTRRGVSEGSGDPVKHVYKMSFKKNESGEWKLTSTSYKYDLDM